MVFSHREVSFEQQQQQEQKQQEQEQPQGTVATVKSSFFIGFSGFFRSYVRHFLGAILMLPRPSLPWCFPIREVFFWAEAAAAARAAFSGVGGRGGSPYPAGGPWGPELAVSLPYGGSLLPEGEREGPPPLPPTTAYHQKLPRFTVFFAVPIFSHFSEFVAEDGSTWANIGRKMGQKMGQQRPT